MVNIITGSLLIMIGLVGFTTHRHYFVDVLFVLLGLGFIFLGKAIYRDHQKSEKDEEKLRNERV